MSRGDRENALLDTLEAVIEGGLPYVLVGGWAIAAFQPRFTVDIDAVAPAEALPEYRTILTDRGYEQIADAGTSALYQGRTVRFEKDVGNPVKFDLMLDSLGCRQTGAEWSFRYLHQHSQVVSLEAIRPITARTPEQELLFALKLHSGRRADARDLVALASGVSFPRVEKHLHRGPPEKLQAQIEIVLQCLESDGFEDAFKGVFQQGTTPDDDVEQVVSFLRAQRDDC